jgi:hypothetical protein
VTLDTAGNGARFYVTTIRIPAGVEVRLVDPNPAILHSQGTVDVAGHLNADGFPSNGATGGRGGPGGYDGGAGAPRPRTSGSNGLGPGGGGGGNYFIAQIPGGPAGHATPGTSNFVSGRPSPTAARSRSTCAAGAAVAALWQAVDPVVMAGVA